jgi:hypothetical protein
MEDVTMAESRLDQAETEPQTETANDAAADSTNEIAPDASPSLYIKNLNEKIKLDGKSHCLPT